MRLCFELDFLSSVEYYAAIIREILRSGAIKYEVDQVPGKIRMYLEGEQEEIQRAVEDLGARLPLSIYARHFQPVPENSDSPEACCVPESGKEDSGQWDEAHRSWLSVGIWPEVLQAVLDEKSNVYFNPAAHELPLPQEYPKAYLKRGEQSLAEANTRESYQVLISQVADVLQQNETVRILTRWGYRSFALESKDHADGIAYVMQPEILREYQVSEQEMMALWSCERPVVKVFGKEGAVYPILRCKMPEDALLSLLAHELRQRDIPFLFTVPEDSQGVELSWKAPWVELEGDDLEVVALPDRWLVVSGSRSIFPLYLPFHQQGAAHYANEGIDVNIKENEALLSPSSGETHEKERDHEGAILSVLAEKNLLNAPAAGLYFSLGSEHSGIYGYHPEHGLKVAMAFGGGFKNVPDALKQVAAKDDNTARLVENYQGRFPEAVETFQTMQPVSETLLGQLSIPLALMGFLRESENARYHEWLCARARYGSSGSVKIDMKLNRETGEFDWLPTLQSILSFKMAGVELEMLAYGLMESLSDFLNDNLHALTRQIDSRDAMIAGDALGDKELLRRLLKHASNLYTIHHNVALPMDRQNIAYGLLHAKNL